MKSFKENFNKLLNDMKLARTDVMELCELTEDQLEQLEDGIASQGILYQFVLTMGIDYCSVYSDDGMKSATLEEQFAKYPLVLKKIISRRMCRKLIKLCKSEDQFRNLIRTKLPFNSLRLTRTITGNSAFDPQNFHDIYDALSGYLPESNYNKWLSEFIYPAIANYNYNELRSYFKVSYEDISDYIHCTPSGASNWGGIGGIPIPSAHYAQLGKFFGGFTKEEFSTQILSPELFVGRKCEKATRRESSIIKIRHDKPSKTVDMNDEEGISMILPPQIIEPEIKHNSSPESNISEESQKVSDVNIASKFEELSLKLFANLSTANKVKVMSLIAELAYSES